jgi:hypothetical protein
MMIVGSFSFTSVKSYLFDTTKTIDYEPDTEGSIPIVRISKKKPCGNVMRKKTGSVATYPVAGENCNFPPAGEVIPKRT